MPRLDKDLYIELGALLKEAREQRRMSLDSLSEALNSYKTKSTLKRYEDGVSRLDMETYHSICEVLGIDPDLTLQTARAREAFKNLEFTDSGELLDHEDGSRSVIDDDVYSNYYHKMKNIINDVVKLPVYAPLCCGNGSFVDDEVIDYVVVPSDWLSAGKEYFGQIAKGDSMIEAQINDGDILMFEKTGVIDSGTIGCLCIDDNIATCKKFMVGEDHSIYLMPANGKYPPIKIDDEETHFKCVGKLAFVVSDRRDR